MAAPAAAAVFAPRFKDVRGTQKEQDERAELERIKKHLTSASAESTKRARSDTRLQSSATAESSVWPQDAPWFQPHYVHPKDCRVEDPAHGESFSASVPSDQRVVIQKNVRRDYDGKNYLKARMDSCSHAIIKCIRHSLLLPRSLKGWCFVTDIAFLLWRGYTEYYYILEER